MQIPVMGNVSVRQHSDDAGADLITPISVTFRPGQIIKLDLGVRADIPQGYVGLLLPRSSVGAQGIRLMNTVGVIDSGFRGSWVAVLENASSKPVALTAGQRILQVLIVPIVLADFVATDALPDSVRGSGGFGSTGGGTP